MRENALMNPNSLDAVMQPKEFDGLTLIACEKYSPDSEMYQCRRMVRAVFGEVW
ncbi:hypothetical protein KQH54_04405 [bacterium]|nr:hypothetical protein [bacterium]